MTQQENLKVVQCILGIMEVLAEDHNGMSDKRKVMSLFNELMTKNVNVNQLQEIVGKFIEGSDNR